MTCFPLKRLFLMGIFSLAALIGCDNSTTGTTDTTTPTTTLGKELFDTNCSSCHGTEAQGTSTYSGSIKGATSISNTVLKGKGAMPSFPKMTTAQIQSIEMYLATLKVDLSALAGKEYFAAVCAACHGASGEGTTRGYGIQQPVTGYASYVIRNGRTSSAFADAMPKYASTDVSDKQLTEMVTWLKAFPKPTDGKGLFNTYCANCHGKDARGGAVGEGVRGESFLSIVRSGHGGTTYSNRGSYMPSWTSTEITNAEITLMEQYVKSL
jgi:mono/diheme cytochrome c family protein